VFPGRSGARLPKFRHLVYLLKDDFDITVVLNQMNPGGQALVFTMSSDSGELGRRHKAPGMHLPGRLDAQVPERL
jgi:hypothetical protein